MAIKYYIEYNDVSNSVHRLEIYDDNFAGAVTEVNGIIFLDYSESKEILDPIKGAGLRVQLEADSTLTFSDLYSEYEKDFQVIYKRDSVVKFNGWLNPEGWFEDFVQDKWRVSFDCIDGLSFLENLSYTDINGLNYIGKQSLIETISNCLFRTGLQQDIRADIGIVYSGLTTGFDILNNAKIDSARYIKDDEETVMSCQEVLISILEIFGAVIANVEGYWYIYKPNQLFLSSTINYHAYTYDGVIHTTPTGTKNIAFSLGSEIKGYEPHHCSGNQSISNEKSIGAFRSNYKYGALEGILANIYLDGNGTIVDEWTIDSMTNLLIPPTNRGVDFTAVDLDTESIKQMTSDAVPLLQDEVIDLRIKMKNTNWYNPSLHKQETYPFRVKIVGATTLYYNKLTNIWAAGAYSNKIVLEKDIDSVTDSFFTMTIPIDGNLTIELWSPYSYLSTDPGPYDPKFQILMQRVELITVQQEVNLKGEFHTFQRTDKPNSRIEDVKEVFNGDNTSATYLGTIYKADEITLTDQWTRLSTAELKPILRIMGEEILRLNANTKRMFKGNVFGYFNFLSVVSIDGFTDALFLPIKYRYDTKANIISAEFKQIFGLELPDIDYEKTSDYGNVVKPTIKG